MDFKQPKKKKVGPHIKPQQPFPILIESENGISIDSGGWPLYAGTFTGDKVIISNPEEMIALYTMGYFGKGSLSRGYPSFELTKQGIPPIIKERQWRRRKCWIDQLKQRLSLPVTETSMSNVSCGDEQQEDKCEVNNDNESKVTNTVNDSVETISTDMNDEFEHRTKNDNKINRQVLVIADSDDEDLEKVLRDPQPHLEVEEIKTVVETLHLTLEEAFFLSYALGCLQVIDLFGKPMSILELWQSCCEVNLNFVESYVVYHYYRAKGWVVKNGYKFGGDFLLYKQGPPFYHASYIVLVEKLDSEFKRLNHKSLTWTKLHGLNRLAENSGKDIIICQVFSPKDLNSEDVLTPKSLSRFQVNEVLNKRWISAQEREEKDHS